MVLIKLALIPIDNTSSINPRTTRENRKLERKPNLVPCLEILGIDAFLYPDSGAALLFLLLLCSLLHSSVWQRGLPKEQVTVAGSLFPLRGNSL